MKRYEPFRGPHARLDYLTRSQHRALDRLRESIAKPKRAFDVFDQLFGRPVTSEPNLLGMATGESIAHLNFLICRHEATKEIDADDVASYRLKQP